MPQHLQLASLWTPNPRSRLTKTAPSVCGKPSWILTEMLPALSDPSISWGHPETHLKPLLGDRPPILIRVPSICRALASRQSAFVYIITFNCSGGPVKWASLFSTLQTLVLTRSHTYLSPSLSCFTFCLQISFCSGCCPWIPSLTSVFLCSKSVTLRTERAAIGLVVTNHYLTCFGQRSQVICDCAEGLSKIFLGRGDLGLPSTFKIFNHVAAKLSFC